MNSVRLTTNVCPSPDHFLGDINITLTGFITPVGTLMFDHSRDGRIIPKNLPIMLFGIAMIFALILCQNMPTQIHY